MVRLVVQRALVGVLHELAGVHHDDPFGDVAITPRSW